MPESGINMEVAAMTEKGMQIVELLDKIAVAKDQK